MGATRTLALRSVVAVVLAAATVAAPAAVHALTGAGAPTPRVAVPAPPATEAMGMDVAGQNAKGGTAEMAEMAQVAAENGLTPAPGDDICGHEYEFHTVTGLQCALAPMLPDMFTASQLAAAKAPQPATQSVPKVTCIGDGSDGKRMELVYARRAATADRSAATDLTLQGWAATIEQTMVLSAQKTGGVRKARWVTNSSCEPTVLNITVPNTVVQFSDLVSALQAAGLTSKARKYLVAWDDTQPAGAFCGLGQVMPDSSPGLSNQNETQPLGAMFAAIEPSCWTGSVAAHEVMHTLGAVQDDAPNSSGHGHCTDESDIMCYVDGPGVVMRQVCPTSQESLYDCNDDDYFNTNPAPGSYLKTHWDPANSGFLDQTGSHGPPTSPASATIAADAGQVTVSWTAPGYDGGGSLLGYVVTVTPGNRVVSVAAPTLATTISGLADGTAVTASVAAVNQYGTGVATTTGPATPAPAVHTLATTAVGDAYHDLARGPSGSVYLAGSDRIEKVDASGAKTLVVHGTSTGGTVAEGTDPLSTPVAPQSLAVAPNGDLYWFDSATATIRRLSGGKVSSVAGNGQAGDTGDGHSALAASIDPSSLAIDPVDGSVLFTDPGDGVVRRFVVGGTITRVAGNGTAGFAGDGGAATSAELKIPSDLAVDSSEHVYVADTYNHRIRRFTVGGTISTVAGDGTQTIFPTSPVAATSTAVSYPSAVDWSPDRGLLIDTFGLERVLSGTNLVRLAGDIFSDADSDADGTPAPAIDFTKHDSIVAVTWSGSTLHVLTTGPVPGGSGTEGKLRSAGPWHAAAAAAVPAAPAVAPVVTAGQQAATVAWLPASNNGSAITGYRVTASPGGATTTTDGLQTSVTVTGLAAGTAYTFTVAAVNGVGTGPASVASSPVTPSAKPSPAPFASWTAFVQQQFRDLVDRAPTSTELATWTGPLSTGAKSKGDLDASLRTSSENLTNVDPMTRLYRAFLGRAPDAGGLRFWIGRKRAVAPARTWSLNQIAASFTASSEFKAKYGALSNRAFVTQIYTDVLLRAADPSGVAYWTKKLDTKSKTRAQVVLGFSESNEYKTKQAQNTDAAIAYIYLLGRSPSATELAAWVTAEKGGTTDAALLSTLLASPAYAARFPA